MSASFARSIKSSDKPTAISSPFSKRSWPPPSLRSASVRGEHIVEVSERGKSDAKKPPQERGARRARRARASQTGCARRGIGIAAPSHPHLLAERRLQRFGP